MPFCAKFTRNICKSETANSVIQTVESGSKIAKKILKVNIKHANECFDHMNEIATLKTAAQLGIELSWTGFATCESCAIGKAQQRNVPKESLEEKATTFNGRVGHDLSKIKVPEGLDVTVNKPNWHIMDDQSSGFKQSNFFMTKNEIINYIVRSCTQKLSEGTQFKSCAKIMLEKMLSWSRWPRARIGS